MRATAARAHSARTSVLAVAVFVLLLPLLPSVHAQGTNYVISPSGSSSAAACSAISGQWGGASTCTIQAQGYLAPDDSLTVSQGAVLQVSAGATLSDSGSIEVVGGLAIVAGSFVVTAQGSVQDNGTLAVETAGSLTNSGFFTAMAVGGNMTNLGNVTNSAGATMILDSPAVASYTGSFFSNLGELHNLGQIQTYADLNNGAGGSIVNSGNLFLASHVTNKGASSAPSFVNAGLLQNAGQGTVTLSGETLNNTGTLSNYGSMGESQGVYSILNNLGTFLNYGTMVNGAFFANLPTGNFTNFGSMDNDIGCAILTCGSFSNEGTAANAAGGVFDNQGNLGTSNTDVRRPALGSFVNSGTLNNFNLLAVEQGGTFNNSGSFLTTGSLTNSGAIGNSGSFENSGTVVNLTDLLNEANGTIVNAKTVTNSGTIDNEGSFSESCEGVIDGSGLVEGNPIGATTTCTTFTPAPEFPGFVGAVGTLLGLLAVALVAGRIARRPSGLVSRAREDRT